ncbi:unnamed protein product [Heligmosomoides polygyrus]|uniref:SWIM-type domain-containing protein n=1 Tax=Heligmosomoides polygyrus TaxID=6339 RepID=A0A183GEH9_HELPZ|nr:unnamed protein product [Heligmosomoides polygyrus]
MESGHAVYFISKEEHLEPLPEDLKRLLGDVNKDEPSRLSRLYSHSASFLADGRINEECACLHSAFAHRCGHLMREAVRSVNIFQVLSF